MTQHKAGAGSRGASSETNRFQRVPAGYPVDPPPLDGPRARRRRALLLVILIVAGLGAGALFGTVLAD